ncbi:MAG: DUF362 domain-containing protein [Eubacteriales bacterium]|nr:DUF362 domain-containing protein [Eubacteriales bacterium]
MQKNDILSICGTEYKEMTIKLLKEANLKELIPDSSSLIGIKPNLVAPSEASWGATTHPEIVAGIIEYLKGNGFQNLRMIEGSWVGDKTMESAEVCGFLSLSEEYKVPFLDMQQSPGEKRDAKGLELSVCKGAAEVDFLINVPVLKGHCQTKVTCALKNMKGLIPNPEKRRFHALGLHKPIAHLNAAIHQDFVVVDNICGDLDFEDGGNPFEMNRILAGRDPVLMDAYAAHLMHYEVEDIPYIVMAGELGVGSSNYRDARLFQIGDTTAREIPLSRKVLEVQDVVQEVESCSACYGYLIPALQMLKDDGLLSRLPGKICIGQGYRGKEETSEEIGIGNCTRKFSRHLPGCPPTETQIYEYLKALIHEEE